MKPAHRLGGRPSITFTKDEDRHAVAFLEMRRRLRINGKPVSGRMASMLAAIAKEGRLLNETSHKGPPPRRLAPSGHRDSPQKPALRNEYVERSYTHYEKAAVSSAFESLAKRLSRKHRASRTSSRSRFWVLAMARAWLSACHPEVVQRIWKRDPERMCASESAAVGESEYAEKVLLPLLHALRWTPFVGQVCGLDKLVSCFGFQAAS